VPVGTAEVNWSAVVSTLLATVLGSFAALWAQGAPVNRGMRVALLATLGFVGALLLLVGLMALAIPTTRINPWVPIVVGLSFGLPLWPAGRRWLAHLLPIEPASVTHAVALTGSILLLLLGVGARLAAGAGPLASQPISLVEIVVQHLGAAVLAAFGVGLYLRRSLSVTRQRLGLTALGRSDLLLALAVGLGFGLLSALLRWLLPVSLTQPDRTTALLATQAASPLGALLAALTIALGMELLFRGALQPRLGLVLTACLFTAVNILGGAPLPELLILGLGLLLGLLRQRTNTTASLLAHTLYNLTTIGLLLLRAPA
jgi:hypothetical protein